MNIDRRAFIAGSSAFLAACSGGSVATTPLAPSDAAGDFGARARAPLLLLRARARARQARARGARVRDARSGRVCGEFPSAAARSPGERSHDVGTHLAALGTVLPNLPPVSTQGITSTALGSPGTCEAQSFAYGFGFVHGRTSRRSARSNGCRTPDNLISSAYVFAYGMSTPKPNGMGTIASCPKGGLSLPYPHPARPLWCGQRHGRSVQS